MHNFKLTLKSGKEIFLSANGQQEAMAWYKREINPDAEIVKCEWVKR